MFGLNRGGSALDAVLEKPLRRRELLDCLAKFFDEGSITGSTAPRDDEAAAAASTPPLRILVAEDNKVNQAYIAALLAKAGHAVDMVENGHQAVDAVLTRDAYDVVLMDVQMPELDGVEATKRIRALDPPKCDVPILALTANAMAGARDEYLAAGMDDYVPKPIRSAELRSKLAALVRRGAAPTGATGANAPDAEGEDRTETALPAPDLDPVYLNDLVSIMSSKGVDELLSLFLGNMAERLERIAEGARNDDLAALAREAHAIVGAAGNVGAPRVCKVARELEAGCKAGDLVSVRRLVSEVGEATEAVSVAVHSWPHPRDAELNATSAA
jgi:CheY-like chemotaxis protein/HPt (histidine-containing phosphotransfer) domain-containing protein